MVELKWMNRTARTVSSNKVVVDDTRDKYRRRKSDIFPHSTSLRIMLQRSLYTIDSTRERKKEEGRGN